MLQELAEILREETRQVDLVCRYGGDEFVILQPETPYEGALSKGEALRDSVASHAFQSVLQDGREVRTTISVGVTSLSPSLHDGDELLRLADESLLSAKRQGRNRVSGTPPKKE